VIHHTTNPKVNRIQAAHNKMNIFLENGYFKMDIFIENCGKYGKREIYLLLQYWCYSTNKDIIGTGIQIATT
jgi:hypothetical protein